MTRFLKGCLRCLLAEALQMPIQKYRQVRIVSRVSTAEEPDLHVVARLVSPGDLVIDVGANYGLYTRFLSDRVGPSGHVMAFEPVPSTYEVLVHVIQRLQLANALAFPYALSDHAREVTMRIPRDPAGGKSVYRAHIVRSDGPTATPGALVRAHARTLDSLLLPTQSVSFVKIDVEGHELPCVRGAAAVISRDHPAFLIEVSPDPDLPGTSGYEILHALVREGYACYWFDGERLRQRASGDRSINYFFLQPEHLELVRPLMPR